MEEPELARWPLIRDTFIFQIKLAMDAMRDLFLSPVSIICALIDLFKGHSQSKSYFYRLMDLGHRSDTWLNLFGDHQADDESLKNSTSENNKNDINVDQLFSQVESLLKDQHDKGGLTASAKDKIDLYLNKIVENKNTQ
ncbi:hypothetical protein [Thalassotalea atypica]|uniref:hypothetical protein n=1 Tax=Thalassotalea atypica TaxID=2054316 RepID=UPI0025727901|nr:hypothetical protein [Thalassotalea atypica]